MNTGMPNQKAKRRSAETQVCLGLHTTDKDCAPASWGRRLCMRGFLATHLHKRCNRQSHKRDGKDNEIEYGHHCQCSDSCPHPGLERDSVWLLALDSISKCLVLQQCLDNNLEKHYMVCTSHKLTVLGRSTSTQVSQTMKVNSKSNLMHCEDMTVGQDGMSQARTVYLETFSSQASHTDSKD